MNLKQLKPKKAKFTPLTMNLLPIQNGPTLKVLVEAAEEAVRQLRGPSNFLISTRAAMADRLEAAILRNRTK